MSNLLTRDINIRFDSDDCQRAADEWGCNCGPAALAAILGMRLDEVRPHLRDFDRKRYMSPTMMKAAMRSIGAGYFTSDGNDWPNHGLARIQFCGPWTEPKANPRWAYNYTHWVASWIQAGRVLVFDVNAGLSTLVDWDLEVASAIAKSIKRCDGRWFITHGWEVSL